MPQNSPAPSGRHIPFLTELEFISIADSTSMPHLTALQESQRDFIHQPRVSAPAFATLRRGKSRLSWVTFPKMFSTLNGLHPIRPPKGLTRGLARARSLGPCGPSALPNSFRSFPNCSSQSCFHFPVVTQRSPTASANAGLNAATALRQVGRSCCSALVGARLCPAKRDQPQHVQTHDALKSFPRLTTIHPLRLVQRTQSRSFIPRY